MPLLSGYLRNERIRSRSVKRELKKIQSDNRGFTLLEVLVAMVILVIVCVPLLRSFATSAQTDAKAKLQMKATTAGENIMEKIKNMTAAEIDGLTTTSGPSTLSGVTATLSGVSFTSTTSGVTYTISGQMIEFYLDRDQLNDNFNADMPEGSTAHVELNPIQDMDSGELYYPYANGLNIADLNSISVRDCAIYTMDSGCDARAYAEYANRNVSVRLPDDSNKYEEDDAKKDLIRSIEIVTEDTGGIYTSETGETRSTYRIKLKIWYRAVRTGVVANTDYTETEVFLFDNTASHKDVQCIYLFYYPRYEAAASSASPRRDQIFVDNKAKVKTDLYITAMNGSHDLAGTPSGAIPTVKNTYLMTGKGLLLTIQDKDALVDGKGCLKLRTNLLRVNSTTGSRTPYSKNDTNTYSLGFTLRYKAGTYNYNDADAILPLTVGNVDGKALSIEDTKTRIYHVKVEVLDPDGNVLSTMNGTKLRQDE